MSVLRKIAMKMTGNSTETASQHPCEFGTPSFRCGALATTTVRVGRLETDGESDTDVTFGVCDHHYSLLQESTTFEIKEERPLGVSASLSRRDVDRAMGEYREETKDLPRGAEVRERYKKTFEDTHRRFTQKVEEEGKTPEQAAEEMLIEDGLDENGNGQYVLKVPDGSSVGMTPELYDFLRENGRLELFGEVRIPGRGVVSDTTTDQEGSSRDVVPVDSIDEECGCHGDKPEWGYHHPKVCAETAQGFMSVADDIDDDIGLSDAWYVAHSTDVGLFEEDSEQ